MSNHVRHGKWWDRWTLSDRAPEETIRERFTRLFDAPAAEFAPEDLDKLAKAMTAKVENPPSGEMDPEEVSRPGKAGPPRQLDAEENPGIVSAYTYLGQFLDHDLTFDPTSRLRERLSPDQLTKLVNFRTPRLDLDNVYGLGPDEQPYLYQGDGVHLQLGAPLVGNPHDPGAVDLPRGPNGRALVGDPRNDENRIVAQLHATMLRFHNAIADRMPGAGFEAVRQQVRWHYQWMVVNDFLPTIVNRTTITKVFPHLADGTSIIDSPPKFTIPTLVEAGRLEKMPVEFSVAAYRFGHSMIRPIYRLNESISRRQIFSPSTDSTGDLGGMRPIPPDWAIDWQFFVDIEHGADRGRTLGNDPIPRRPQLSYKIDTSVVGPLGALPPTVAANPPSLALRNLLRGQAFGLPSGQTVADRLGIKAIPDDELVIGKATREDKKTPLVKLSRKFAKNAPLWTYILAEAHLTSWAAEPQRDQDTIEIRLGPVGGHLVAETFAALLLHDKNSYLHAVGFTPHKDLMYHGKFGLAELINAAIRRT